METKSAEKTNAKGDNQMNFGRNARVKDPWVMHHKVACSTEIPADSVYSKSRGYRGQRGGGLLFMTQTQSARRDTRARDLDPAGRRVRSLQRSLSVLDKWLEGNDGRIDDEVRVRRIKHWRDEALEQIEIYSAT